MGVVQKRSEETDIQRARRCSYPNEPGVVLGVVPCGAGDRRVSVGVALPQHKNDSVGEQGELLIKLTSIIYIYILMIINLF